jgi:hypothetical protein
VALTAMDNPPLSLFIFKRQRKTFFLPRMRFVTVFAKKRENENLKIILLY